MVRVTRSSMATVAAAAADAKRSAQKAINVARSATFCSSPKVPSSPVPSSASQTVTPSPRKGKRKRLEDDKKPNIGTKEFQTPSPSHSMVRSEATTITTESIRSLIESQILTELDDGTQNKKVNKNIDMDTTTKSGWCLVDALVHCGKASNGILAPLILKHGPPKMYMDHLREKYQTAIEQPSRSIRGSLYKSSEDYPSFRALCRTVAGQQLAGKAAVSIWRRLVGVVAGNTKDDSNSVKEFWEPSQSSLQSFTPEALLAVVQDGDTDVLRKPAGLSRAKCDCILAIARSYRDGSLSESFPMQPENDEEIRSQLLSIKGLGPWSVDMFMMFRCHRSNLLPIGDLAVRNGTAVLWKASNTKPLCAKKDAAFITECHAPFEPYRSVSSYYMYKVADSVKAKKKQKRKGNN